MSESYATSRCREFFIDGHGSLYQRVGFPDSRAVCLGKIDAVDPEDAPERIRPAIVEMVAEWAARERRDTFYDGLNSDYRSAAMPSLS